MTPLPFAGKKPPRGVRGAVPARRVVVLGAGVSGLAAALQLDWDGCEVTVVEARGEPGGRVRTLRDTPGPNTLFELGAARIGTHHSYLRACLRWLGLVLDPFYPSQGDVITERKGAIDRRRATGQSHLEHLALTQGLLPQHRGIFGAIRDRIVSPHWKRIRGGSDLLPRGMAEALGNRIHYGTQVTRLEQDGRTVRIECRATGTGAPTVLTADRVICTLPFPVLRDIGVRPALSPDKERVVRELWYESAVRVAMAMESGWDPGTWSGYAWSDWFGELWPTPVTEGRSPTLVWYAQGGHARALAAMGESKRHAEARSALDRLVPGLGASVGDMVSFVWDEDPWARGAQSHVWDYGIEHLPAIQRPEGRIHFAGEHTAERHRLGWLDGALESGVRAAREVLEAE